MLIFFTVKHRNYLESLWYLSVDMVCFGAARLIILNFVETVHSTTSRIIKYFMVLRWYALAHQELVFLLNMLYTFYAYVIYYENDMVMLWMCIHMLCLSYPYLIHMLCLNYVHVKCYVHVQLMLWQMIWLSVKKRNLR